MFNMGHILETYDNKNILLKSIYFTMGPKFLHFGAIQIEI